MRSWGVYAFASARPEAPFDFSLLTTFSRSAARDLACRVTAPLETNQSSLGLRSNRPPLLCSRPTIIMGVRRVACYTPSSSSSSSSSAFSSQLLSERDSACFLSCLSLLACLILSFSSRRLQLRPATRLDSS